jgi:glycosyltransferase involved in cell wall biosynthesis
MDYPSFSIIIPTCQRRDSVCAAVRAVALQCYEGAIELIVVIDGSTDGTAAAVAKLDCPFPCTIVEQPNRGAAAARNRGAAEATGEILLFLDDDMIAETDLVAQHARMYAQGADAVTGHMPRSDGSPNAFLGPEIATAAGADSDAPETAFDILTGQISVRRSVFMKLGGFDESFTADGQYGNEDIEFGARLVENYVVRHNRKAISRHFGAVGPRQSMRRAKLLGNADVHFASKHPTLGRELFERRGLSRQTTRYLYRPIGRLPFVPAFLASIAVHATELGSRTRFRSSPGLARLYSAAYATCYWSAVGKALRLFHSKQLR